MYDIEKGVPIPEKSTYTKYPFGDMNVGDSFAYSSEYSNTLRQAATHYGQRNGGLKFKTKKLDNGEHRIWRIK